MELKIEKKDLLGILSRAAPAAAVKSPMALLTCVLLSAEPNGRVTATGTDLVVAVIAETTAQVGKPGGVVVNARDILEIAKKLPFGEVTLTVKECRLHVRCGKSKLQVPFGPADEYPQVPPPHAGAPKLSVGSKELSRLLSQSMYARSQGDENRAFIACVRLEHAAGVVKCVATDSNRLALAVGSGECAADWGVDHINTKALGVVRSLCDHFDEPVCITTHGGLEGHMHFQWPGVTLSAKSAGSKFVPYEKFIPDHPNEAVCSREELIECCKRASLVLKSPDGRLAFEFAEEQLTISGETTEKGSSVEQMEVDYAGKPFEIGLRSAFVLEALSQLREDEVRLKFGGEKDPVLIEGVVPNEARPECLAIIMPLLGDKS